MNIRFKILVFIIFFFGIKSYAQDLNRKNLISQLKADEKSLFVINGLAFLENDSLKLDKELSQIEKSKIVDISIIRDDGKLLHPRKDVILINYAVLLSKRTIRKKLREIKSKFNDEYISFSQHIYSNSKDPVLYLNGNKIHHTESKKVVNRLKKNKTGYIFYSQAPQDENYHGQNAKNGFVAIWTNDRLKK